MGFLKFLNKNKQADITKKEELASDGLKKAMQKTSSKFRNGLSAIFLGKGAINQDMLEELEEFLITADIGVSTTDMILEKIKQECTKDTLKNYDKLLDAIREILVEILSIDVNIKEDETCKPYTILVSGVNGTGKTTSIAKLANMYKKQGKSVMLVAGDTFRAAAADQLSTWADTLDIPIIRHKDKGDPAAVVHDGVMQAKSKNIDVLIIDTAGRLHTKDNLMQELVKMNKVAIKALGHNIHESLIVLDATTGQNALTQVKVFKETIPLTGIILSKLDGTAKGGVAIRVVQEEQLPIRYIGFGEKIDDIGSFSAKDFVDSILYIPNQ